MMLSHFLLGFADGVEGCERIDTAEFSAALGIGATNLYDALEQPVEGTILTVIRDTADAADRSETQDFVPLIEQLVEEARDSLARTPELLPVLKKAGVVDAGAKGFVSLLEGVHYLMTGDPILALESGSEPEFSAAAVAQVEYPIDEEQFRYCTEALVRGDALPSQAEVRGVLREMGDSLIVIRTGSVLKLHVHADEPELVFDYLRGLGELVTHKAEDMRAQHAAVERAASGHIQLARRPVSIVTDSAADLSEEVVRAHGIHVVPMTLIDGDKTFRAGIDISAEEFHRRLAEDAALPTTSQPAPAAFLDSYGLAAEEGESVVAVLVSSTLSGTFASGEAAAARFDGAPVHVADSRSASVLQGLLVMKATELAELGWEPEDIVREIGRIRNQSDLLFTVTTFDRLLASGRVGRGRALLARFLGIKPVLSLGAEGKVVPVGKALGVRRVRSKLMELVDTRIPTGATNVRFGVVHVGVPEIVEPITRELRARYGQHVEIISAPATPVIATHLGIGAWGVAYMVEDA
jgi:DegV family protein with EDD domain